MSGMTRDSGKLQKGRPRTGAAVPAASPIGVVGFAIFWVGTGDSNSTSSCIGNSNFFRGVAAGLRLGGIQVAEIAPPSPDDLG